MLTAGPNPQPIIIDTRLRCPTDIKLFTLPTCAKPIIMYGRGSQDPGERKLFAHCKTSKLTLQLFIDYAGVPQRKEALEALGARVFECATVRGDDGRDHIDLSDAFREFTATCYHRGSWSDLTSMNTVV